MIQDWYQKTYSKTATASVLTHCKRELMHAIWRILLDDEFVHAYVHGIVIRFPDGILRRVFPRIFTYSADYPEKVLLACIKYLAKCPCPHCLMEKSKFDGMGTSNDCKCRWKYLRLDNFPYRVTIDRVRAWIYEKGKSIASAAIDKVLGPTSLVPTRNAFSARLAEHGFEFHSMFVPDLLHEFELGIWKAIFIHLLRVLVAAGGNKIQKFTSNTSEMKKLAGRDFEDLLQCSIPVFEGLLDPPFDALVLTLLFTLAEWHAYTKLRLHTETTLGFFDTSTTHLGQVVRWFASKTREAFQTEDLPQELAAHGRCKAAKAKKTGFTSGKTAPLSRKARFLNLFTYKYHALGYYVPFIRLFGTTDNYTTQVGELEHRRVKHFYARTGKVKFVRGITRQQLRERRIYLLHQRDKKQDGPALEFEDSDPLPYTAPEMHHHMSTSTRHGLTVADWVRRHSTDPAFTNFYCGLKDHVLLARSSKSRVR
ncbi:hypothetical protein OF83DRAFT_1180165 [Amylostereum chailletii]|nr:hypothetical protein OF83DRAFT_1180165 [Amylostereum chailletii]